MSLKVVESNMSDTDQGFYEEEIESDHRDVKDIVPLKTKVCETIETIDISEDEAADELEDMWDIIVGGPMLENQLETQCQDQMHLEHYETKKEREQTEKKKSKTCRTVSKSKALKKKKNKLGIKLKFFKSISGSWILDGGQRNNLLPQICLEFVIAINDMESDKIDPHPFPEWPYMTFVVGEDTVLTSHRAVMRKSLDDPSLVEYDAITLKRIPRPGVIGCEEFPLDIPAQYLPNLMNALAEIMRIYFGVEVDYEM